MEYRDASQFKPLPTVSSGTKNKGEESLSLSAYDVKFLEPNELRVNQCCIIEGHPSKIKEISKSCPGKHGSAKFRVVGVGLFDDKKRNTIFHDKDHALVPAVETRSNVVATIDFPDWIKIEGDMNKVENTLSFPKIIAVTRSITDLFKDEDLNFLLKKKNRKATVYVDLSVVVCCNHFFISRCKVMTDEKVAEKKEEMKSNAENAVFDTEQRALSKKDQRKLRKQQKKEVDGKGKESVVVAKNDTQM